MDGRLAFTRYSRNRWTAYGSPALEDWIQVALEEAHTVSRVELYLYGDGRGVGAPTAYRVEVWKDGAWAPVTERGRTPERPTAWALNTVTLDPVETSRLRVVFTHDGTLRAGLTELRVFE